MTININYITLVYHALFSEHLMHAPVNAREEHDTMLTHFMEEETEVN